jgi:hypothetical protein
MSPYSAFDNNPIFLIDPLGLKAIGGDGDPEKKSSKGGTTRTNETTTADPDLQNYEVLGSTPLVTIRPEPVQKPRRFWQKVGGFVKGIAASLGKNSVGLVDLTVNRIWDKETYMGLYNLGKNEVSGAVDHPSDYVAYKYDWVKEAMGSLYDWVATSPDKPAEKVGEGVMDALLIVDVGVVALTESAFKSVARSAMARDAVTRSASSRVLNTTARQLQAKFKHASDFGIDGNWNKLSAVKFNSAINQHVNSAGVRTIIGTYRGNPVIHYVNPSTGLNVISSSSGEFISGWKLSPAQLENVLKHGGL